MDPNRKITKKFTKNFDSKVIDRQYFHRKTGLKTTFILHLRSTVARVEAGAEILLFDAWHVSVAPRSSRVTWGTDKVFCTVLLNVFSKLESIKWLSLHQVTWGIGSPEKRNRLYHIYTLNSLFFFLIRFPKGSYFLFFGSV